MKNTKIMKSIVLCSLVGVAVGLMVNDAQAAFRSGKARSGSARGGTSRTGGSRNNSASAARTASNRGVSSKSVTATEGLTETQCQYFDKKYSWTTSTVCDDLSEATSTLIAQKQLCMGCELIGYTIGSNNTTAVAISSDPAVVLENCKGFAKMCAESYCGSESSKCQDKGINDFYAMFDRSNNFCSSKAGATACKPYWGSMASDLQAYYNQQAKDNPLNISTACKTAQGNYLLAVQCRSGVDAAADKAAGVSDLFGTRKAAINSADEKMIAYKTAYNTQCQKYGLSANDQFNSGRAEGSGNNSVMAQVVGNTLSQLTTNAINNANNKNMKQAYHPNCNANQPYMNYVATFDALDKAVAQNCDTGCPQRKASNNAVAIGDVIGDGYSCVYIVSAADYAQYTGRAAPAAPVTETPLEQCKRLNSECPAACRENGTIDEASCATIKKANGAITTRDITADGLGDQPVEETQATTNKAQCAAFSKGDFKMSLAEYHSVNITRLNQICLDKGFSNFTSLFDSAISKTKTVGLSQADYRYTINCIVSSCLESNDKACDLKNAVCTNKGTCSNNPDGKLNGKSCKESLETK